MSILDKDIREITGSATFIKELADLYYNTFNERMKVGCFTCYSNAYIRLKSYIYKKELKSIKMEKGYKFELSVSCIRGYNSNKLYTNETLTDEIAIDYLRQNKARIVHFKKFPEDWEELLKPKKARKKRVAKKVENTKEK